MPFAAEERALSRRASPIQDRGHEIPQRSLFRFLVFDSHVARVDPTTSLARLLLGHHLRFISEELAGLPIRRLSARAVGVNVPHRRPLLSLALRANALLRIHRCSRRGFAHLLRSKFVLFAANR